MPDLCFYAPWIMKEPIPDPFRMMLEKAGKNGSAMMKRIVPCEISGSREKSPAFMGLRYMHF